MAGRAGAEVYDTEGEASSHSPPFTLSYGPGALNPWQVGPEPPSGAETTQVRRSSRAKPLVVFRCRVTLRKPQPPRTSLPVAVDHGKFRAQDEKVAQIERIVIAARTTAGQPPVTALRLSGRGRFCCKSRWPFC